MNFTSQEHPRRAERRALVERLNAQYQRPLIERRIDAAERAAHAAFPIDKLALDIGVIERVIAFEDSSQRHMGRRVLPWTMLIATGCRHCTAELMRGISPRTDFDDELWRVIEATQPVTADQNAVDRVVEFLIAACRTLSPVWTGEAEFTALVTGLAEKSRLRMEERIEAAHADVGGLRLIRIDEQWSTTRDPEGMRVVWERLGRPCGTGEAFVETGERRLRDKTSAKSPKTGTTTPPLKHITDDAERDLILAEERGSQYGEDDAREFAVIVFRDIALNAASWRTRAYVIRAEGFARTQFELRPKTEQRKILRDAVCALHRLLTTAPRSLSVRPRDLYSGHHLGDVLHLLKQYPRLWRLIALEGVINGALLFEEREDVAITLANPNWRGDFASRRDEWGKDREIRACQAAMDGPYPETLPDSSWLP
jgi:hypothetical protein